MIRIRMRMRTDADQNRTGKFFNFGFIKKKIDNSLNFFFFQGCISIWNSYFCPTPLLIDIFPQIEICHNGVRAAGENSFWGNFVQFKSIGEKICILFTKWEKNMHFHPFVIPFQSFFSPTWGRGVKQKNIHPCFYFCDYPSLSIFSSLYLCFPEEVPIKNK